MNSGGSIGNGGFGAAGGGGTDPYGNHPGNGSHGRHGSDPSGHSPLRHGVWVPIQSASSGFFCDPAGVSRHIPPSWFGEARAPHHYSGNVRAPGVASPLMAVPPFRYGPYLPPAGSSYSNLLCNCSTCSYGPWRTAPTLGDATHHLTASLVPGGMQVHRVTSACYFYPSPTGQSNVRASGSVAGSCPVTVQSSPWRSSTWRSGDGLGGSMLSGRRHSFSQRPSPYTSYRSHRSSPSVFSQATQTSPRYATDTQAALNDGGQSSCNGDGGGTSATFNGGSGTSSSRGRSASVVGVFGNQGGQQTSGAGGQQPRDWRDDQDETMLVVDDVIEEEEDDATTLAPSSPFPALTPQ